MDTGYLSSQVSSIIGQLHGLFDEIGVPTRDRESRESELFAALSEALHNQVRIVASEKNDLTEEAQRIITNIKQMAASLDDNKNHHEYEPEYDDLKITYPLLRCLQGLKEKHLHISKVHRERFEQVKKLVQALESYSSHLEPSFIKIELPPTSDSTTISPTFDLSNVYVTALDDEFTRVYEEYTRRLATVKATAENIIQLWAELGTPQAQTDAAIVKYSRDSPEQLGLHEDDINRLRGKRDKLNNEKKAREKRLADLRATVEALWQKLGVEEPERRRFLNGNRGCGVRQINEFEDELSRLNELKRQNLHLFVEDARFKLQALWDGLYFSEEEMLEFTPAFSDVYSDALLEAHEQEIQRLESLKEQRAPTLALIDEHRSLVKDRDDLQASSQDASRLMMRGQKGEKRDPTRLLREEKMRKRIAKDLPKIAAKLRKVLEDWEDEYGRPFLVHGERYLDELDSSEAKPVPGPRSKTPAGPPPASSRPLPPKSGQKTGTMNRANSVPRAPPSRAGAKTPTGGTLRRNQSASISSTMGAGLKSPTRGQTHGRIPLSSLNFPPNSPERARAGRPELTRPESRQATSTIRGKMGPPARAPPPMMRELFEQPPPSASSPYFHRNESFASSGSHRSGSARSGSVRPVSPEDVFEVPPPPHENPNYGRPQSYHDLRSSMRMNERQNLQFAQSLSYGAAPPNFGAAPPSSSGRQISNTSSSTTAGSGSENWETYGDASETEPEDEGADEYYARLRAARQKRYTPEEEPPQRQQQQQQQQIFRSSTVKHQKSYPPNLTLAGQVLRNDRECTRIVSGSEANWTDEDAF